LICSGCNLADASVKKRLGLPSEFSFSPAELSHFITGHPHGGVTPDLILARRIYAELVLFF
jgi:hypothetical protein